MKKDRSISKLISMIGLLVLFGSHICIAADFPNRPITIICPYPPGGAMDAESRIIAKHIEPILKQPVIVETKTGSAGVIGYTAAAKSPPDGYTLTLIATPIIFHTHAIPGVLYTSETFEPIAHLNYEPSALVIKTGSKFDMPPDQFFTFVKNHPEEVRMGSGGRWASVHMAIELFELGSGMKFRKVFFDGSGPAIINLLGGHVDASFPYYSEFFTHTAQGTLKPLGVASDERYYFLPNVSTFREMGMDVIAGTWRGLAGPKGTPEAVLQILENACREALKKPEVIEEFRKIKIEPSFKDRNAFRQVIAEDTKRYKPVVDRVKASRE